MKKLTDIKDFEAIGMGKCVFHGKVCSNFTLCFRRLIYPTEPECYLNWSQQQEWTDNLSNT